MNEKLRQLHSVFLTLLMAVVLAVTALATAGSIRVTVKDEADAPVSDINVELIRVAADTGVLTAEFAGLPLTATELMANPGATHAETVYQYFRAKELSGTIKQTNAAGVTEFTGLDNGLYLVLERGNQLVAFQPYLVVVRSDAVDTLPKTIQPDTGTVWVSKIWEDNMNAAGLRPSSIQVTLSRNGTPIRRVTLSDANLWQHTFTGLPNEGTYSVEESAVASYTATYYPMLDGFTIVNTYTGGSPGPGPIPNYATVTVHKVWNDADNAAGLRPSGVTMQLVQGGTVIKTAVLSEANNWQYTFSKLDPAASYTVQEIAVPGYLAAYSGNAASGITVTNTLQSDPHPPGTTEPPTPVVPTPEPVSVRVEKVWDDNDNALGNRPEQVVVHLISSGSVIATARLEESSGWKADFTEVPGNLSYTVWEEPAAGYSAIYSGNSTEGFRITNILTSGTTDPGVPLPSTPVQPPEIPEEPTPQTPGIPQTGTKMWPVYLLTALGLLFVTVGGLMHGKKVEP